MSLLMAAALAVTVPIEDKEIQCLATAVHHEARGEGRRGMEAVAQVVLNRVQDKRFASSICGVVYQKSQFSGIKRAKAPDSVSISVAKDAIAGKIRNWVGKSLYFGSFGGKRGFKLGNHRFW